MKTYLAAMIVITILLGATCELEAEIITCIDLGGGIKKCGDVTIIDL